MTTSITSKSISKFILKPENDQLINNVTESGLYLHNQMGDEEEGRYLNRVGIVIQVPLNNNTSIKEGDRVIVQHNTFRKWLDYGGDLKHSNVLDDGSYFVDPTLIYAYERDNQWYSTRAWIFIDPSVSKKDGILKSYEEIRPDKGTIAFKQDPISVSYTHLTLPTIYSV